MANGVSFLVGKLLVLAVTVLRVGGGSPEVASPHRLGSLTPPPPAGAWAAKLDHGGFKGFPTYEEANAMLDGWIKDHPDLLRRERIGYSYDHRPIYAYVLGASSAARQATPPQVLFTALMHSREPASLTVVLYFLGRILELCQLGEPEAVYLLRARELWVVPFVNPDGYVANNGLKTPSIRKNRRPTCPRTPTSGGVDINRNFPTAWLKGAFPVCDEEYGGTAPFSEPETQAIKKVCDDNSFKAAVNFHSYGSMLTHPYNYAPTIAASKLPKPDDNVIYEEVRKAFGFLTFGPAIATVGYTAIGESDDWLYDAKGIISMSPEVGPENGGFMPPASLVKGIDERNFRRCMYIAGKAGLELGVSWRRQVSKHVSGGGVLEVLLQNSGLAPSGGVALGVAIELTLEGNSGWAPADSSISISVVSGLGLAQQSSATTMTAQLPQRVVFDGPVATAAFQASPLQRRSLNSFHLKFVSTAWLQAALKARVCVFEAGLRATSIGRAANAEVCQCVGPARLASAPQQVTSAERVHVKADQASPDQTLCASARSAVDFTANDVPWSRPSTTTGQPSTSPAATTKTTTASAIAVASSTLLPLQQSLWAPAKQAKANVSEFMTAAAVLDGEAAAAVLRSQSAAFATTDGEVAHAAGVSGDDANDVSSTVRTLTLGLGAMLGMILPVLIVYNMVKLLRRRNSGHRLPSDEPEKQRCPRVLGVRSDEALD